MDYYVYILRSVTTGSYYIGQTSNLTSRLEKHNKGYVKSTKHHGPWELKYQETFTSRKDSIKRERQIKSWKSRARIEELMSTDKA